MATHKGSEGTIKVDTNTVAEIRSYSIEESADTLEITSMGDTAREYVSSLTSFSGSIDVFWDETDANGQGASYSRCFNFSDRYYNCAIFIQIFIWCV